MSKKGRKKLTPDTLFGELRAILQQPLIGNEQRLDLWNLCDRMYRDNPERYTTQWIPYLEAYASAWQPEHLALNQFWDLKRAVALAPFARFTISLKGTRAEYERWRTVSEVQLFCDSPLMAHVTALQVGDTSVLLDLLDSPHTTSLQRVRALDVTQGSPIDLLDKLARSSHRETLHTLQFKGSDYDQYSHLAERDFGERRLPALRVLEIEHVAMSRDHLTELLRSCLITPLQRLSLAHTALEEEMLELLATRSHKLEAIESLDLSGLRQITGKSTWLIETLDTMPELRHLAIRDSFEECRPTALATYLAKRADSKLESLDLSHSNIGLRALQTIASSKHLPHLHALRLNNITLNQKLVTLLATHPFFGRLERLDLHPTQLDASMAKMLAKSSTLAPHLTARFASWKRKLRTWPNI